MIFIKPFCTLSPLHGAAIAKSQFDVSQHFSPIPNGVWEFAAWLVEFTAPGAGGFLAQLFLELRGVAEAAEVPLQALCSLSLQYEVPLGAGGCNERRELWLGFCAATLAFPSCRGGFLVIARACTERRELWLSTFAHLCLAAMASSLPTNEQFGALAAVLILSFGGRGGPGHWGVAAAPRAARTRAARPRCRPERPTALAPRWRRAWRTAAWLWRGPWTGSSPSSRRGMNARRVERDTQEGSCCFVLVSLESPNPKKG